MRLKLALVIAAIIALPIAAQAGNHEVGSGHKVKTALGKIKGESGVDNHNDQMPIDSYSETR